MGTQLFSSDISFIRPYRYTFCNFLLQHFSYSLSYNSATNMAIAAIGQLCSTASMSHRLAQKHSFFQKLQTTLLPVRKNPSPLLGPWKAAHSSSVSKPLQRTTT